MIQINIMARISDDKNFFFDVVFALYRLQEKGLTDIRALFIGDIMSPALYYNILKLSDLLNVTGRIKLTKKSMRFSELSITDQNGYFLNFTVGDFKGYSGIESINTGLKTIFYNVDRTLNDKTSRSITQCFDIDSLVNLLSKIYNDPQNMDALIITENNEMKQQFFLNDLERDYLRNVIC